jgi:hypothetical protein
MSKNLVFSLEDLRVLGVHLEAGQASGDDGDGENENAVMWSASFYEPNEQLNREGGRIVIASLHAHANDGWGTVTVGGVFAATAEVPDTQKKVGNAIAKSAALESLYDLARITFKALAGTTDAAFDLPYKSPKATVEPAQEPIAVVKRSKPVGGRTKALQTLAGE